MDWDFVGLAGNSIGDFDSFHVRICGGNCCVLEEAKWFSDKDSIWPLPSVRYFAVHLLGRDPYRLVLGPFLYKIGSGCFLL